MVFIFYEISSTVNNIYRFCVKLDTFQNEAERKNGIYYLLLEKTRKKEEQKASLEILRQV